MKRITEATPGLPARTTAGWLRPALAWLALLLAAPATALAQEAAPANNRLEAVEFQALGGQQMQFRLRTSGPAPQPMAFTIDKPARISLDLPGVQLALPSRRVEVKAGGVDSLVAGEAAGRTRVNWWPFPPARCSTSRRAASAPGARTAYGQDDANALTCCRK